MKKFRYQSLRLTWLMFLVPLVGVVNLNFGAQDGCCPPPSLNPAAARFQKNAQVTVYLDTRTGFTSDERAAIKAGLEDWNDEPNNSGVDYNVIETDNPPAPGGNNTIIATYTDQFSSNSGGAKLNIADQRNASGVVTNVNATLQFYKNIRSGTPSLLLAFLRSTARHEGGHGIGLENSDTNACPQGSNIMWPSANEETFITNCDNSKINEDPVYGGTPTATPTPTPVLGGIGGGGGVCQYDDTGCEDCVAEDGLAWQNCRNLEAYWYIFPNCSCSDPSPILVDVLGNGFDLTSRANGVMFDLNNDGIKNRIPWTTVLTDDAWLCLDRDGNGTIDNGGELFGNFTSQPEPPLGQERNGFLALAEYDKPLNGGNGDGLITTADAIFNSLRLWQDVNHNGSSESVELFPLHLMNTDILELSYKKSKYTDQYGNEFRYRAKVKDTKGAQVGRWMWDVFFVRFP